MNILVTGGAGYIGSVLVPELLRAGHFVIVLDNFSQCVDSLKGVWNSPFLGPFCFFDGDISNHNDLREPIKDMDIVIHLAAVRQNECSKDSKRAWMVNYYATRDLVNICTANNIKIIFASSCSVYGISHEPMDEKTPTIPISTYAKTKLASENVILDAGGIVLRFATAYGESPCMRRDLIVHRFLADAMKGKIVLFDPNAYRPLIHVKDIARGIALSVQTDCGGQIFNLGEGNYTKSEIVETIKENLPDVEIELVECGDVRDYQVSFEKAHRILGFVSDHNIKDWLKWTCGFIK